MLRDLKVGDKVILSSRYGRKLTTVAKITPTGLIKVDSFLFYPDGRRRTSDMWNTIHIEEATEENIQKYTVARIIHEAKELLAKYTRTHIDIELAKKIIEVLGGDK